MPTYRAAFYETSTVKVSTCVEADDEDDARAKIRRGDTIPDSEHTFEDTREVTHREYCDATLELEETLIDGLPPWDYAAIWDSPTPDGELFYNAASDRQIKDRGYLSRLLLAIANLLNDTDLTHSDRVNLRLLRTFVEAQYAAAPASPGPPPDRDDFI